MFKKILVAYDGSDHAIRALDVAIDLASKYGAKLDVVEVVDTAALLGMGVAPIPGEVIQQVYNKAKTDVENAKAKAQQNGVKEVEAVVLEGDPATAILEYASKNGSDLIVTGSRGLSTFKRIILGSVSTKIVEDAKTPVLVVK
ncbi:universal stress protein [Stygiolobus caldivivus]|uniref:Universal stress protein UspA n=1 Tax=Stygiolobus caldivivus TaxID=2824673 RepID=A0A8D5U891_9CREN|nr:universal stress protein [Stygiolobus caldivivus]BCU71426.1 universal stress protein UspA [Stygiolobus caldivivus]